MFLNNNNTNTGFCNFSFEVKYVVIQKILKHTTKPTLNVYNNTLSFNKTNKTYIINILQIITQWPISNLSMTVIHFYMNS